VTTAAATILVVEDEPDIVHLVQVIMRRGGYTMIEAGTVQHASRVITKDRPDLVLLDLGLPDGEGWEILGDTRAHDIPVVLLSAHSSPATARRAEREGVAGYLTKPFTPEQLLSAVGSVIKPAS
jgi:DNA-binding response OmpR family regulator